MTPRILVKGGWPDAVAGDALALDPADLHHLVTVLRRRPGDAVELFDGEGRSIAAVLEVADEAARDKGRPPRARHYGVRLIGPSRSEPAPRLSIGLAQGISSQERMDWTIEKAIEAGVERIVPLQTARSGQRSADARRLGHWERIIVSASAQCGRNRLARLEEAKGPAAWLGSKPLQAARGFLLSPTAPRSLTATLVASPPATSLWLACGPEAGFDDEEASAFVQQGWEAVSLGPRVLRTETAALMAVAIIQSRWGDLT